MEVAEGPRLNLGQEVLLQGVKGRGKAGQGRVRRVSAGVDAVDGREHLPKAVASTSDKRFWCRG